jgi:serine/threonine-protein kinase
MDDQQQLAAQARTRVATVLKDKWTIDRVVGVGGMATVYAATHRNQKRVAIKMLHPELSSNVDVRTRFLREGYVANTVGHRGAVSVDDDDITEDGAAFLVMELLEGETLEDRRSRKGGRLAADEVLSLVDQLLDVLAAAHEKGVVHRDLKPENLFFTQEGVLKVLDFGIARLRDGSADAAGRGATRTGSVMGTPAFMAPEQARARWEMVDGQTDLWAVGATMFTLLSGRFVREAGTVNEELALAITAPAVSLSTVAPDLGRPVVELVDRALAYEKADRWSDARAMQVAVRLAYHALLGEEVAAEDAVAGGQAPRAVMPSIVQPSADPLGAGQTPSMSARVVDGTTLSQPASPVPARGGKVAIAAAAAVAVAAVVIGAVVLRSGGSAVSPPAATVGSAAAAAASPTGSALASAAPVAATAEPAASDAPAAPTAAPDSSASAAATAEPAPTAAPTASATSAPAPKKAKPPAKPKPAPEAKPAKRDPLSRIQSFFKGK